MGQSQGNKRIPPSVRHPPEKILAPPLSVRLTISFVCLLAMFSVYKSTQTLLPYTPDKLNLGHANSTTESNEIPPNSSAAGAPFETKPTNMKLKLQQRFQELPPAPWPQLDHRMPKAIVDGTIVGNKSDIPHNHTIVTAYYQFGKSKHGVGQYKGWFERILNRSDPMVIFVEPEDEWSDFVKEHRAHAPTIVAELKFEDLVMSSTFTESFWNFMHSIDHARETWHKTPKLYQIWNEKLIFMYAAIKMNPFDTPGFAWMDAGYFRREVPKSHTPVITVNITEAGVPEEKVLFMHVRNDTMDSLDRCAIAGNGYAGTSRSFLEFYPKYYRIFWHWCTIKKFIGSDQYLLSETCWRHRENCHPFFARSFKNWFALAQALGGRMDFSNISPHYVFDKPIANMSDVPSGKKVSYCNGEVVTRDMNTTDC